MIVSQTTLGVLLMDYWWWWVCVFICSILLIVFRTETQSAEQEEKKKDKMQPIKQTEDLVYAGDDDYSVAVPISSE